MGRGRDIRDEGQHTESFVGQGQGWVFTQMKWYILGTVWAGKWYNMDYTFFFFFIILNFLFCIRV